MDITIKKSIIISTEIVFIPVFPVCIYRGQLWDPTALPIKPGWFLPRYAGLRVQTRPAALYCRFPYCAIHQSGTHHVFGQRAGTRGTLQNQRRLGPASLRSLPNFGRRAPWKVQQKQHTTCASLFYGVGILGACSQYSVWFVYHVFYKCFSKPVSPWCVWKWWLSWRRTKFPHIWTNWSICWNAPIVRWISGTFSTVVYISSHKKKKKCSNPI